MNYGLLLKNQGKIMTVIELGKALPLLHPERTNRVFPKT
jgi:hypothetical protein